MYDSSNASVGTVSVCEDEGDGEGDIDKEGESDIASDGKVVGIGEGDGRVARVELGHRLAQYMKKSVI